MSSFTSQKADGNVSGFYKYPRANEIQNRSNLHKNRVSLPTWTEPDELSNSSAIRKPNSINSSKNSPSSRNSNQNPQQPNPKSTDLKYGRLCSSGDKLCNWWCGNLRPEGNIRPNPFSSLQLTKLLKLKLLNVTPYANFWISELQVSDILLPHPSNPKSFCLGPQTHETPTDLISCEANRIPFESKHRLEPLGRLLKSLA